MENTSGRDFTQEEFRELLDASKPFISNVVGFPVRMRRFPVQMNDEPSIVNQVNTVWVPFLRTLFGSILNFIRHMSKSIEGKNAMKELFGEQISNVELQREIKELKEQMRIEFRDAALRVAAGSDLSKRYLAS